MSAAAQSRVVETTARASLWLKPHRIGLIAVAIALVVSAAVFMRWDWIPKYYDLAREGIHSLRPRLLHPDEDMHGERRSGQRRIDHRDIGNDHLFLAHPAQAAEHRR